MLHPASCIFMVLREPHGDLPAERLRDMRMLEPNL